MFIGYFNQVKGRWSEVISFSMGVSWHSKTTDMTCNDLVFGFSCFFESTWATLWIADLIRAWVGMRTNIVNSVLITLNLYEFWNSHRQKFVTESWIIEAWSLVTYSTRYPIRLRSLIQNPIALSCLSNRRSSVWISYKRFFDYAKSVWCGGAK